MFHVSGPATLDCPTVGSAVAGAPSSVSSMCPNSPVHNHMIFSQSQAARTIDNWAACLSSTWWGFERMDRSLLMPSASVDTMVSETKTCCRWSYSACYRNSWLPLAQCWCAWICSPRGERSAILHGNKDNSLAC
jgi:hypothetical protein